MTITPTQGDREAAAEMHKFAGRWFRASDILVGECDDDEWVQAFALHAQAARIEGAKAMQEAAGIAARDCLCDQEWPPQDGDVQIDEVRAAIRSLDPHNITGEAG